MDLWLQGENKLKHENVIMARIFFLLCLSYQALTKIQLN